MSDEKFGPMVERARDQLAELRAEKETKGESQ